MPVRRPFGFHFRRLRPVSSDTDLSSAATNQFEFPALQAQSIGPIRQADQQQEQPVSTEPVAQGAYVGERRSRQAMMRDDISFEGRPGESIEYFLRNFEDFVETNELGEREAVRYLLGSLKGSAREWWLCRNSALVGEAEQRALDHATRREIDGGLVPRGRNALTVEFLKEHLLRRYQTPHRKHLAQQELIQVRQGPGEKVGSLAARIQQLGEVAFGHLTDDDRQDCLIHYFVNALTDANVKLQVLASKPDTFEAAFETASLMETSREMIGVRDVQAAPTRNKSNQHHTHRYAAAAMNGNRQGWREHESSTRNANGHMRNEHTRNWGSDRPNEWTSNGRPICRYCQISGHVERDCRTKIHDSEARGRRHDLRGSHRQERGYRPRDGNRRHESNAQGNSYHAGRNSGNLHNHRAQGHYQFKANESQHGPAYRQTHAITTVPEARNTHAPQMDELCALLREQSIKMETQNGILRQQGEEIQQMKRKMEDPWQINGNHMHMLISKAHKQSESIEMCSIETQTDTEMAMSDETGLYSSTEDATEDEKENIQRQKKRRRKICRKHQAKDSAVTETNPHAGMRNFRTYHLAWHQMLVILILILLGRGSATEGLSNGIEPREFFLCRPARGGVPLQPPSMAECPAFYDMAGKEEYAQFEVWAPDPGPTVAARQCMFRNRTTCIDSDPIEGDRYVSKDEVVESALEVEECHKVWETKQWQGVQVRRRLEGLYTANVTHSDTSSNCETVSSVILQRGTIGLDLKGKLFSSVDDLSGCSVREGSCQTGRSTVIWDRDSIQQKACPYRKREFTYLGEKKGNYVRLYKVPEVLHIINGPLVSCLPGGAILLKEGLVIKPFTNWNRTTKWSDLNEGVRESNLVHIMCELHKQQRAFISLLFDIDPTLGIRLTYQRKDIQAMWQGDRILASECHKIKISSQNIRWDHKLEGNCYHYMPVQVKGAWMYASPAGELFSESITVPCTIFHKAKMGDGEYLNPTDTASFDLSLPMKFYDNLPSLSLNFSLSDFGHTVQAPLSNLPASLNFHRHCPEYARDYSKYFSYRGRRTHNEKNTELYFATPPAAAFDRLYQETVTSIFSLAYLLLNSTTQMIVNVCVFVSLIIKIFGWLCCSLWKYLCCKPACPRLKRHRRTRLREMSTERTNVRNESRRRRTSVLTVGPTEPNGEVPVIITSVFDYNLATLMDSGATMSVVSAAALKRLPHPPGKLIPHNFRAVSACGRLMPIKFGIELPIQVGTYTTRHFCGVMENAPYDLILGMDALTKLGVTEFRYNLKKKIVRLDDEKLQSIPRPHQDKIDPSVRVIENVTIRPHSYARFYAGVENEFQKKEIMFEPNAQIHSKYSLLVTPLLCQTNDNSCIPVEVYNPSYEPITIYRGTRLGKIMEPEEIMSINLEPRHTPQPQENQPPTSHSRPIPTEEQLEEIGTHLPPEEASQLRELLRKNRDVFSQNDYDLGTCKVVEHTVDTQGQTPIKMRPYRLPFAQREVLANQINEMLKAGLIRPSSSEWAFPCLLVKKKEQGQWRMVIDYRKLNKIIKVDQYRLPHIDDILYSLGKAKFYSSLDMCSGYWQLKVAEKDQDKLAFTTFQGLYTMTRMPMGVSNAGATYQRAMEMIFTNQLFHQLNSTPKLALWKNVFIYLDDVLLTAERFSDHLLFLEETFQKLRAADMRAKFRKCQFIRKELPFLGHIVTTEGLKPDPKKVESVKNFPRPTNQSELRTWLGLASYYRRYIEKFGQLTAPLNQLLRKTSTFIWASQQEEAFQTLKLKLTTAPVLAYPQFDNVPFIIHCDASGSGIGAILSQTGPDGHEHPIMYASRALQKTERKYHVTEQEALAVIFGLKTFRPFVYQKPTTLYTDHQALKYLLNTSSPNGRVARWGLQIQEYMPQLEIQYRPGKSNANADALSRAFVSSGDQNIGEAMVPKCLAITQSGNPSTPILPDNDTGNDQWLQSLATAQRADTRLGPIIEYLTKSTLPAQADAAANIKSASERYTVENELLLFQADTQTAGAVLEIPGTHTKAALYEAHDKVGHFGIDKTWEFCKRRFHWPLMYRDVREYCRTCQSCQARKQPQRFNKAPLKNIKVEGPWDMIGCDIVGPLKNTEKGNKYIITFCDYFTKFAEAFAVPEASAAAVATLYITQIVCRYGAARVLRTDQGKQYTADLTREILHLCGTSHGLAPPYSPWCSGQIERLHRTLENVISQYITDRDEWDNLLPYAIFAYNTAVHSSTKQSPYFLMFGRDAQLPIDTVFDYRRKFYTENETLPETIMARFTSIYAKVRENIEKAQSRQKRYYDRNAQEPKIAVGDLVALNDPTERNNSQKKFAHPWKRIYRVMEIEMPDLTIKRIDKHKETEKRVHVNNVKLYKERNNTIDNEPHQNQALSDPHDTDDGSDEY